MTDKKVAKKVETTQPTKRASTSPGTRKVFDMHPPGRIIPSSSSKPVITTNRTRVRNDPMVTQQKAETSQADADVPEKEEEILTMPKKLRLEPLHAMDAKPVQDKSTSESTQEENNKENDILKPEIKIEEPKEDTSEPEEVDEPAEAKVEEESPDLDTGMKLDEAAEEKAEDPEELPVEEEKSDEKVDQEAQAAKQNAKELDEKVLADMRAAADVLIESKKYFVPINSVKTRKSKRVLLLIVIVTLAVAGFAVALDAGLISAGVDLPFNFI